MQLAGLPAWIRVLFVNADKLAVLLLAWTSTQQDAGMATLAEQHEAWSGRKTCAVDVITVKYCLSGSCLLQDVDYHHLIVLAAGALAWKELMRDFWVPLDQAMAAAKAVSTSEVRASRTEPALPGLSL